MNDIENLVRVIELHHRHYPDHGISCACMDKYIQNFRKHTDIKEINSDFAAQARVDYVIRKAIENRY